jgi:hypothetical protein
MEIHVLVRITFIKTVSWTGRRSIKSVGSCIGYICPYFSTITQSDHHGSSISQFYPIA